MRFIGTVLIALVIILAITWALGYTGYNKWGIGLLVLAFIAGVVIVAMAGRSKD